MHKHRGFASKAIVLAALIAAASVLQPDRARAATVAGVTPGALTVDERGQASYEIPLSVPPGIAGMAPSLSLIYSSASGNGIAGLGWSLGGLSAIHRCARTLAQDGAVGGIGFDADDRFCLDGKRLVAIAGVYGADGTEYRTEIDGLFKVVSYGAAGTGPAWWRVWSKSGQVMDYGATPDSRIEAQGRTEAKVWAVGKIADTAGNYLTLSYFEDALTGAHRIDRIDYAANDAAAVAAQSSVAFLYEPRPDVIAGYVAGSRGTMDQRLAAVQTFTDGALVRDYRLAYETGGGTGRSRLTGVTECDGAGNCLQPTSFTWKAGSTGWQQSAAHQAPFQTSVEDSYTPKGRSNGEFLDVNGDGRLDFVKAFIVNGTAKRVTWLSTENGWQESLAHKSPLNFTEFWTTTTTICITRSSFKTGDGSGVNPCLETKE
jgi:hypothetical protein